MREEFDEDEFPPVEQRRTTELTLSTTVLLVLFFVLVLLCGLCFGVGYTIGSRGVHGAQQQGAGAASQAAGSHSKPSAVPQKTPDAQSIVNDLPVTSSGAGADAPHEGQANLAGANSTEPLIKPAQPDAANALMIQVATVTRQEDADILISALSKRSYTATARHDPADNKLHVQLGPFSNRNDAEAMRKKLLHDGYNAIVQP